MNIFNENADFYPTSTEVIEKMMMSEYILNKTVLEPSAGKGNIVDWLKVHGAKEVITCENNPHLRKLLNGKCDIIADDFLSLKSGDVSHVDYTVMNPPFSDGAKHLLHAFDIAPAGCTVIALCNSHSVSKRWRTDSVKERLIEIIDLYGREEYFGNVFSTAERKTEVTVSLVKLYKERVGDNEFSGYFFSQEDEDTADMSGQEGLMHYNVVRDIVNRYVAAVKLFDNTLEASKRINKMARFPDSDEYDYIPIKFGTMTGGYDNRGVKISHQQYKKSLQKYYWRIIFKKMNMEKYATKQLREQINKFIEQQESVPFTMCNIYRVIDLVIQTNGQRMNTALLGSSRKFSA